MFSSSISGDIFGMEPRMIKVEADVNDGLPIFQMVGYLSSEVKEAKERVRVALKNSSFRYLSKRITVNLSPADLRKQGTSFDLAIAVSLLAALGEIPTNKLNTLFFLGELSLDGQVLPVRGVLPLVMEAKRIGINECFIPFDNAGEGRNVEGIHVYAVKTLSEVIQHIRGVELLSAEKVSSSQVENAAISEDDFSDIQGQEDAKEAIEIAVGGMHNLLIIGPPGTGKTMLAKRIPSIMPAMTKEEQLDITKIQSICGELLPGEALVRTRPFRAPHHSITSHALIGGGVNVRPGELTLATGGVLFLDELAEFKQEVLDMMRQPMENNEVVISRIQGTYRFPSRFMLVAAMNPCKCGYYPNADRCRCTPIQVSSYLSKISEPLLDRMDMSVETIEPTKFTKNIQENRTTQMMKEHISIMQERQKHRFQHEQFKFNSLIPVRKLTHYCHLGKEEQDFLDEMLGMHSMSMRGVHNVIRTARTIADQKDKELISCDELMKAFYYRRIEKKYWRGLNE